MKLPSSVLSARKWSKGITLFLLFVITTPGDADTVVASQRYTASETVIVPGNDSLPTFLSPAFHPGEWFLNDKRFS